VIPHFKSSLTEFGSANTGKRGSVFLLCRHRFQAEGGRSNALSNTRKTYSEDGQFKLHL